VEKLLKETLSGCRGNFIARKFWSPNFSEKRESCSVLVEQLSQKPL